MSQMKGKFTVEELATANKKEIAQAIKDQASPQFLTNHKLTGAVKYLVKHTNKEVLIAAYRNLYETKDFKPEAQKAASAAPADLPGTSGKGEQEADMEAPSESWSTTSESWSTTSESWSTASEGGSLASESWSTTSESWSTASEGGSPVSEAADQDLRLDDETRSRINRNKVYIISNLNAAPCIDFLQSYGLINPDMYDELEAKKSNPREQVNDLLFLVGRSTSLFRAFVIALRDSNQQAIIDLLMGKPQEQTDVTAPAHCGSLRGIKDRHHLILDNLRFEDHFLTHLEGRRVLTSTQVDELMSILTRRDRAQRLLRLLEKGETAERTRGLVSALYETDQPHLAHLIETGDDSEIINKQLKLDARGQKLEIMAGVRRHIQQASLPTLLSSLEDKRILTPAQSDVVQAAGNPELQCKHLVDMITCRPWCVVRDNLVTDPQTSQVTFRVPALEGTPSSDKELATPEKPVCDSTTTDSLVVTWAEPEECFLRYAIAIDGGETKSVAKGEERCVTFTGLVAGTTYTVSVRTCQESGGLELMSNPASTTITTMPGLRQKAVTEDTITIEWPRPLGSWDKYEARITPKGGNEETVDIDKDVNTYHFSKLTPVTKYTIKLKAVGSETLGEEMCIDVQTLVGVPRNVSLKGACCWGITLIWDRSKGGRDKYQVRIAPEGGPETITDLHESSTSYQFRDLSPATKYIVKLSAWYAGAPSKDCCFHVVTHVHSPHSSYAEGLRKSVKEEAIMTNKQLNERFGIDLDTVLYCDLAMASQLENFPTNSAETWKTEEYIRRTAESVQIKGKISIDDIFESSSERVIMLGGAGMGKSTVLQEQARRWGEGQLKDLNIQASYRFECRHFTYDIKERNKVSLVQLFHMQHALSPVYNQDRDTITQFVADHESEILVAIDGLDELAKWPSCGGSTPVIRDVTQPAEIHHIVYNLIHKRLLPRSKVIVTTRPISSVKQRDFERCLVALGFSEDSIKDCMRALCKTEDLAKEVIDYIYRTNLVADCIVPLTCILLGVILRRDLSQKSDGKPPSSAVNSMTRLYSRVSQEYVWRREDDSDTDLKLDFTSDQISTLRKLSALAARGMLGDDTVIMFDNSDMAAVGLKSAGEGFGLLEFTPTTVPDSEYLRPCTALFLHLTVQEFFAALHIALGWDPKLVKKMSDTKTQRLHMTTMFVFGLLGDPEGRRFLRAVDPEMSDTEAEGRVKLLLAQIGRGGDKLARLQILRCVAEGKVGSLVPTVEWRLLEEKDGLQTLDLQEFPGGLLPHHLAAVGYGVQYSQITSLVLQNCQITGQGVQALERSSQALTGLKKLVLTHNPLEDAGMAALGRLLDRNLGLQDLQLWKCQITAQGVEALVRSSPHLTGLRELWLSGNPLGDAGVAALGPLLARNPGLHKLYLRSTEMGDAGAASVCSALRDHRRIRFLRLEDNQITDPGADRVADLLRSHPSVGKIYIYKNNLSEGKKSVLKEEFGDRLFVYDYSR